MFHKFLNSLKRPENISLIEAIHRGYNACFEHESDPESLIEAPTAEVNVNGDQKYVDFHVEDVIAIEGEEKALKYVNNILKSLLITNKPIEINKKYTRGEEISTLLSPKNSFTNRLDKTVIISHLRMIKENLEEKLGIYASSQEEKIGEYV